MVGRSKPHKALGVLCLFVALVQCHEGHNHEDSKSTNGLGEWNNAHHIPLKVNQGIDLKWLSKDAEWITMEMSSFTKGYISVGFCSKWKGTMEGCDIVIGWVDNQNGTAHLYDYYARGNTLPELDVSQDYELLDGSQEGGVTTIKFRRKWNTGDEYYDADFEHNKVRVMWAWHPEDPFSADSFFKHAGNSRGHMLEDISLKNPDSNVHYHEQLLATGGGDSTSKSAQSNLFIAIWLTILYTFILA